MKKLVLGLASAAGMLLSAPASAFNLNDCGNGLPCPWVQYGDGLSYSLPVNALLYSFYQGGSTGPGNPFYVVSTPGAIKDLTVIGTGSSGGPVTNNYAGADNAYPTPNSDGITYFSTGTTADPNPTFTGDQSNTWDVQLGALKSFLANEDMVFFFNNNQTKSGGTLDENLAVWAQITLTQNGVARYVYDFTNMGGSFVTGGGNLFGSAGSYTSAAQTAPGTVDTTKLDKPLVGTNAATDYVLSGGPLCYNNTVTGPQPTSCAGPFDGKLDHNLGANQAAYAVVFPELNAFLASLFTIEGNEAGWVMNVNLRMGCDPAIANSADCLSRSLNNGYEQVFISTTTRVVNVPVPATTLLMGLGILAVGFAARQARSKLA